MNRIDTLFNQKKNNILSVYFTAGFPKLNDTKTIIEELEKSGADLIEIGIPFSDPLADGVVIQQSSQKALENGMSLRLLFEQLNDIRKTVRMPLILMGYLNIVLQYGVENFCRKCNEIGIDGVILPDLPLKEYQENYQQIFKDFNLHLHFLVTPQTAEARIREIDNCSTGFIYMVSSASTTGAKTSIDAEQEKYFSRMKAMQLTHPLVIGFGISNRETFQKACNFANGAIIGSAFVKAIEKSSDLKNTINQFITNIL